jgi:hypothetical protein
MTSCPLARRASPTAIPGNKWPPVPPQAMRIFRDLGTDEGVKSLNLALGTVFPHLFGKN